MFIFFSFSYFCVCARFQTIRRFTSVRSRQSQCICKALGMRYICHSFWFSYLFFSLLLHHFCPGAMIHLPPTLRHPSIASGWREHRHGACTHYKHSLYLLCSLLSFVSRFELPRVRIGMCHVVVWQSGCKSIVKGSSGNIYGNALNAKRRRTKKMSYISFTGSHHNLPLREYTISLFRTDKIVFFYSAPRLPDSLHKNNNNVCASALGARVARQTGVRLAKELSFLLFNFHLELFIHLYCRCCRCCCRRHHTHTIRQQQKNNAAAWRNKAHKRGKMCNGKATHIQKCATNRRSVFHAPKRKEFMKHF